MKGVRERRGAESIYTIFAGLIQISSIILSKHQTLKNSCYERFWSELYIILVVGFIAGDENDVIQGPFPYP